MNVIERINEWFLFQRFKTGNLNLESGRLNNVSDELLARVIKQQPDAIKFLKKQSEELQMLAVESAYAI
ncbi:MAG: hypothetical protein ACRC26_10010, partial [Bacteroidales bacterium]